MKEKWVTAWGNAISITERRPENYTKNLTLRYPVLMLLDGEAIRITLDNFCGTEPVTISEVWIAKAEGDSRIDPDTSVPLTFSGSASVTIPAGERIKSDPIQFSFQKGTHIAVSLWLKEFTEMRSSVRISGPLSGGFFALGNQTTLAQLDANTSKKTIL